MLTFQTPRIRPILFGLATVLFIACNGDSGTRNPYLNELGFRYEINLNLPLYNPLINVGNAVYVPPAGAGIRGVFVMNTGFDVFRAFEASCPNHSPNNCSTMDIDGQVATCQCDGYEYSLFTGQLLNEPGDGDRFYNMLEYRASLNGNILVLTN